MRSKMLFLSISLLFLGSINTFSKAKTQPTQAEIFLNLSYENRLWFMSGFANGIFGAHRVVNNLSLSLPTLGDLARCIDTLGPSASGELAKEAVYDMRHSDEKNALFALLLAGLYSRCADLGKVPQWEPQ